MIKKEAHIKSKRVLINMDTRNHNLSSVLPLQQNWGE